MRTEDLISRLAANLSPIERDKASRRLTVALTCGLGIDALVLGVLYGYASDMPEQILQPMFWLRLSFPLAIMAAALNLTERMGRPGAPLAWAWIGTSLPILTMFLVAAMLRYAPGAEHRLHWDPPTSNAQKIMVVALLSFPAFVLVMREVKRLRPTMLKLAGFVAGLLAGAQGLFVYSVYCPEPGFQFWSLGHLCGSLCTALLGAWIGPRYLKW